MLKINEFKIKILRLFDMNQLTEIWERASSYASYIAA
jgi:hypothetical protein